MQKPQSVRVRADVKQPLTSLLTAKTSVNLNSAPTLHQRPQSSQRAQDPDPSTACLGQMPVLCLSNSTVLKQKLHYIMHNKSNIFFYNAVVYDIVIVSGNWDACE